jgi:ankyrin repeat protein
MSLFISLPRDVQREVLLFLQDKELSKVNSPVFNDNDIFWKMKIFNNNFPSYKDIYILVENSNDIDMFVKYGQFEKYLSKNEWKEDSVNKFFKNETFLRDYINLTDKRGWTMLMYMTKYGRDYLWEIEDLIASGINVNHRGPYCETALTLTSNKTYAEVLLSAGADPNMIDKYGNLSLFVRPTNEIIEIAIKHGLDVNHKNNKGETPLIYFSRYAADTSKELIEILVQGGADIYIKDKKGKIAADYINERLDWVAWYDERRVIYNSLSKLLTPKDYS